MEFTQGLSFVAFRCQGGAHDEYRDVDETSKQQIKIPSSLPARIHQLIKKSKGIAP